MSDFDEDDPREVEARLQRYGSTMHAADSAEYERIKPLCAALRRAPSPPVERIDRILAKLRALWLDEPDMRLGQLVVNVVRSGAIGKPEVCVVRAGSIGGPEGGTVSDVFNIEDDDFEGLVEDTLKGGWV